MNVQDGALITGSGRSGGNAGKDRAACAASHLPLLLLPGTLCDGAVFAPMLACMEEVADRVTTLALPDEMDMARAARAILAVAPPRFALLGFSLGGILAVHTAALAPERVGALAIVAGTGRPVPEAEHAARRADARGGADDPATHVAERLAPAYFGHLGAGKAAGHRQMAVAMAGRLEGRALLRQSELALSRPDARTLLPRLTMPTLVLAGRQDAINPPAVQREMVDLLPRATLTLIDGAGHFVLLEKPAAVATAIAGWLHAAGVEQPMKPTEECR